MSSLRVSNRASLGVPLTPPLALVTHSIITFAGGAGCKTCADACSETVAYYWRDQSHYTITVVKWADLGGSGCMVRAWWPEAKTKTLRC